MNFNYIFLLTDFYNIGVIPPLPSGSSIIIPFSKALIEQKKKYLLQLASTPYHFCIAVAENHNAIEDNTFIKEIHALTTYFFLPNYIKKSGAYILLADRQQASHNKNAGLKEVEQHLLKQGISPISIEKIDKQNDASDVLNKHYYYSSTLKTILFSNNITEDILAAFFNEIVTKGAINKQIIVPVISEKDFIQKQKALKGLEQWVFNNEKSFALLMPLLRKAIEERQQLETENKKLKFRIANYTDYVRVLKETALWHVTEYSRIVNQVQAPLSSLTQNTKDPAVLYKLNELQNEIDYLKTNRDSILNWYTTEYESLPLWYKRFGHIIKAALGKKSFKSLVRQ